MPLLAHGVDHAALDGPPAGAADGDAHLVVAGQAVEFAFQLPGISSQLLTAHVCTRTQKTRMRPKNKGTWKPSPASDGCT